MVGWLKAKGKQRFYGKWRNTTLSAGFLTNILLVTSVIAQVSECERYVGSAVSDARAEAAEVDRGLTVAGLGQ